MVHGHLGITRAAVEGIVRMQVSPDFSLSHTHVTTRPVLDITLRGVARTTRNNNWLEDELVNVTQQINDACDQWLARDEATGRLRTIMPGIYDVPFSFTLPPNLPPSFRAWDAAVKYTLTATLRFRETIEPDRSSLFTRQVSEIVTVRKYHPDHIVTPLDVMSQRPSSPVYEFEHAESDSSATNNEFSFGELGLDFMKPLTLSNVGSDEEIVHYTVSVPNRSYGPDEVVSANLTIEKLPDVSLAVTFL
ncbi:hypothetical protein BC830DRAFT_171889 [Chytriomyces sp. MP71]|nr:hypothetical protein BC830DRAFT_171889 [Chytriomyces sp. MP71]